MADALFVFTEIAKQKSSILNTLDLKPGAYGLVTVHRSGNVDDREKLGQIMSGLAQIEMEPGFPHAPAHAER